MYLHKSRTKLLFSCTEYNKLRKNARFDIYLLDVRAKQQFLICALWMALSIFLLSEAGRNQLDGLEELSAGVQPIYCLCRRGIFSVEATRAISEAMNERPKLHSVYNISGGLA
jgi:rhodanese-related sulfurtransferase